MDRNIHEANYHVSSTTVTSANIPDDEEFK